jgi:hypothetical protein
MFTPNQERAMDCKFLESGGKCKCKERWELFTKDWLDCREWYSEKYGIEPCIFWQKREDK